MSYLEYFGNIQDKFKQKPGAAPQPLNADGRLGFGLTLDVATSLPKNPTSYNDKIEKARLALVEGSGAVIGKPAGIAAGAVIGSAIPGVGTAIGAGLGATAFGIAELDKKTEGKVSSALMAGTKGVRSNYAFTRDIAKHDAGMGILSGLMMIGVGVGAAAAIIASGGAATPAVAAGLIAAYGTGKAQREAAKAGLFDSISKDIEKSAKLSETAVGQERYNFGRDVVHTASKITTWETLGDTSKGIGAITSGIINIGFEAATAPDIKAVQVGGKVARNAFVGGIADPSSGLIASKFAKSSMGAKYVAKRLADDVDLLTRTGAGEKTAYTPVFEFYRNNDVATIMERGNFKNNEFGQIGANLVAGKSDEAISLVLRVGRGDKKAIEELEAKHPATFAEMLRYEGVLDTIDARIPFSSLEKAQPTLNGKQIPIATEVIENEIKDLRTQFSWLDKSLKLDSALQSTTVSRIPGVESFRNDIAKQRAVNNLEQMATDTISRETAFGNIIQTVYQKNPLSAKIISINRRLDDAPHQTVNFNDALQSATRVRTTMRAAITQKVFPAAEAKNFYDSFVTARNETQKLDVIDKLTERVFEQVANKYNVPASIKDLVLTEYVTLTKKNRAKAKAANAENKAYMIEGEDVVKDPQLISQLANGAYLPDVVLIDKAFARYAKRKGQEVSLPVNTALMGKAVLDEFNSIWRYFTLARTGFPVNIMRDSTLRTWADASLFGSFKALTEQGMDAISKSANTASQIRRWGAGVVDPKKNMGNIREQIKLNESALLAAKDSLGRAKYDPANPPKEITPELKRLVDYVNVIESTVKELRRQEEALVKGIPSKRVGRDKVTVSGYDFPAAFSGRFGDLSFQKLRGKDDIRGLLASVRELEMAEVRRDRVGGHAIKAIDNEDIHLQAWDNTINNILRNDPVSREIMSRNVKNLTPAQIEKEVVDWIRSPKSGTIVERFGYDAVLKREMRYGDAKVIYQRAAAAINQFAPDIKLQELIMADKANALELKKMYPDLTKRPDVLSDLAMDLTGQSNVVRNFSNATKDVVTWLATVPTSRLSYNPYFQAKYESKLQSMVAIANAQGRKLTDVNQAQFEATARAHAINEYRQKINAFNRDMNYPAWLDYVFAFFPAIVEQWRAYGRIALEHPEFPYKIQQMTAIPSQLGEVQTDEFGTDYVEVSLPILGIKGRLPASWFNPLNPTGGHIISAGPVATATVNEVAKRTDLPTKFTETVLPFGTQANAFGALTPNTIRRGGQAFQAFFLKSGEQYNKDMSMFIDMKRKEFMDENHRQPTGKELAAMYNEAKDDSISLSILRALGAGILPSQPRYVSPLQKYSDILSKYNTEYGADGNERFINDYPEYFLLVDKLTDSTSGLRSDDTAVGLVKKNKGLVEEMVATVGEKNLSVLGAVFNDDDYNFSSTAQAYLVTNAIPGTRTKFKEQGAALDNARSSIVTDGWRKWNQLIETVTLSLRDSNLSSASGYGKVVLDTYKKNFVNQMREENSLWVKEKESASFAEKRNSTIDALTIAANSDMWKDLAKQPRWHTIVDYLNFRYDVYDELKRRNTTITTDKAIDIQRKANEYVAKLRLEDINFGKFYDRYFDGDEYNYVPEEGGK
jgi:hypothetical protein